MKLTLCKLNVYVIGTSVKFTLSLLLSPYQGIVNIDLKLLVIIGSSLSSHMQVDKPSPRDVVLQQMKTIHPAPLSRKQDVTVTTDVPKPRITKVLRYSWSGQSEAHDHEDSDRVALLWPSLS